MGKRKGGGKLYAVRVGRRTGIFHAWDDCSQQVHGFSGAQFKSFSSQAQAEAYLDCCEEHETEPASPLCTSSVLLCGVGVAQEPGPAPEAAEGGGTEPCPLVSPRLCYRLEWDGGARGNPGPAGAGAVLYEDESSSEVGSVCVTLGHATNNVAEYRGLVAGLEAARDLGVRRLRVMGDSLLVVNQMKGSWQVLNAGLQPLHKEATELSRGFDEFTIGHMPREANKVADALSNVAMDGAGWEGLRDSQARPLYRAAHGWVD
ncbi:hypothetical protein WJX81_004150 [Elliptochloris bilobata]|uniref:Ribonuclease H n=1 Tax=Elliptochloris bilobata TaxID=381761 RepID=A0AAW1QI14_9CHLO